MHHAWNRGDFGIPLAFLTQPPHSQTAARSTKNMDGQLIQKKDCSAAVQAAMPEAKSLAKVRVACLID